MPAETPPPPPEATLIRVAREAAGIKMPEAARAAGISVARWSQVESGRETRAGVVKKVRGKPGTVAHMARVAGVTPERLATEGGRPDAAEILTEILRSGPESENPATPEPPEVERRLPPTFYSADLDPFITVINGELADAMREFGTEFSGVQAFPGSDLEAAAWDDPDLTPDESVRQIASMRRWLQSRRQNGAETALTRV